MKSTSVCGEPMSVVPQSAAALSAVAVMPFVTWKTRAPVHEPSAALGNRPRSARATTCTSASEPTAAISLSMS